MTKSSNDIEPISTSSHSPQNFEEMFLSLFEEYTNLTQEHKSLTQKHASLFQEHASLFQEHTSLSQEHANLSQEFTTLQLNYRNLSELLAKQNAELYMPKSETAKKAPINEAEAKSDLSVDEPDGSVDDSPVEETPADKKKKRSDALKGKAGRKPIDPSLPRVVIEYTLPDEKCPCCDGALHMMKTNISEQIHIIPKHAQVLRFTQDVYTCRQCEKQDNPIFIDAPMPNPPIKGSVASPSTLAVVLT